MDCREARQLISALIDDELDAKVREAVVRHVAGCTTCAASIESYRQIGRILASGRQSGADSLDAKIRARLARERDTGWAPRKASWSVYSSLVATLVLAFISTGLLFAFFSKRASAPPMISATEAAAVAQELVTMLQSSMAVIARHQNEINSERSGDKGLDGQKVLTESIAEYVRQTGQDPTKRDPGSPSGRFLRMQMEAIVAVMDASQALINEPGKGFKGFIPSRFARLVNGEFTIRSHGDATMKMTAPLHLLRNKQATPDAWELEAINSKFLSGSWENGKRFSEVFTEDGRSLYRVLVPQYYRQPCLACHGEPKGLIDVTGYPREGGKLDDVGGALSVTILTRTRS